MSANRSAVKNKLVIVSDVKSCGHCQHFAPYIPAIKEALSNNTELVHIELSEPGVTMRNYPAYISKLSTGIPLIAYIPAAGWTTGKGAKVWGSDAHSGTARDSTNIINWLSKIAPGSVVAQSAVVLETSRPSAMFGSGNAAINGGGVTSTNNTAPPQHVKAYSVQAHNRIRGIGFSKDNGLQ